MTSGLRHQLQQTLGSAYTIERELHGGGMSRVFVAEDARLGRRVVVKVLHPELAATVSAARFEREIRLAARLQHPHVVPVLTAGEVNGLPYYTMPFVEGETLRERIGREGALPVGEAVRLLRQLLYALVHAHHQGVVHRDLKPDNVLLSGGHVMVADFGVAKALASSVPSLATAGAAATPVTVGAIVGTPAYMAPEQAAGDPTVDHRADLYALGIIAYELLAGHHPFGARPPQELLAAQLTETPTSLVELRPEVPPALAALVAGCLAKRRTDRPQSAVEILAIIDDLAGAVTVTTPAGATWTATPSGLTTPATRATPRTPVTFPVAGPTLATPATPASVSTPDATPPPTLPARPRRRRALLVGALLAATAGAAALQRYASAADRAEAAPDGLVVADFENSVGDSTLTRTVVEALRIDLARSPRISLPTAQQVREALAVMRADTTDALSTDVALAMGKRLGGKAVLGGAVSPAGRGFVLTARLVAVEDGRTVTTFRETAADSSDVVGAIDRLSRSVRQEVGESLRSLQASPRLPLVTTSSLPALAAFTKSLEAGNVSDWLKVAEHARDAVALDPEFGEAWRRIAAALDNLGINRAESVRAATRAYELRDRLQPFERGLAEASYYSTVLGDHRRAAERYRLLSEEFPRARAQSALNNLANAYANLGEWSQALPIARALAEADPRSARFRSNYIGYLTAADRLAEADSMIAQFARDFPGQPNVVRRATGIAKARRDYARTAFLADSALRSDPAMSATGRVYLTNVLGAAAAALGRLQWRARSDAELLSYYQRLDAHAEMLALAVEFAEIEASVGLTDRAQRRLDAALVQHPLADMAVLDRPYAGLAAAWAAAGRPDRAESVLREWSRAVPTINQGIDAVPILRARIQTQLAAGDPTAAERLARGGSFGPCSACADVFLARAFDARGAADSTIAAYERYLTHRAGRDLIDDTELARAYRRLGELYEARGDVTRAVQHYRDFVELWKDADGDLASAVRDARQRLARLESRTG